MTKYDFNENDLVEVLPADPWDLWRPNDSDSPIQPLVGTKIPHQKLEGTADFPPIVSPEDEALIRDLYAWHPQLRPEISFEKEAWIQTFSGKKFYPLAPQPDSICIEDIAHALSMQCRFTGHSKFHYSIAQHSVLVSLNCNSDDALHGLLHDASEAYVCDVAAPVKRSKDFEFYRKIEKQLQSAIYAKFGLNIVEPPSVKQADLKMLATEARDLFANPHPEWKLDIKPYEFNIKQLSPKAAEHYFLYRYYELTNNY